MNIFAGVLALLFCVYAGYQLSLKYAKRKNYYIEYDAFNQALISNVAFTNQSIIKLINNIKDNKDDFSINIKDYFLNKKEDINSSILLDNEKDELLQYFRTIGSSDAKTQLKFLEDQKERLKERLKICLQEEKKYKSFYIKLGFLFGLIIFIILL